jgi:hypothetical protein
MTPRYPITKLDVPLEAWSSRTGHAVYGWELRGRTPSGANIYRHQPTGRVMLLHADGREIDQVERATEAAAIALL